MRLFFSLCSCGLLVVLMAACSATRFIPEGETMLSGVKMDVVKGSGVSAGTYRAYVRQEPNSKWFASIKAPLGIYCMAPSDTTKRMARFFKRIGEAPVIYSQQLTDFSAMSLEEGLRNDGFLHAQVATDTTTRNLRTWLTYHLKPGQRTYVDSLNYVIADPEIERIYIASLSRSKLRKGMPLALTLLSDERKRIIDLLQEYGYYGLNNDWIFFRADTVPGGGDAILTLFFMPPAGEADSMALTPRRFGNVNIIEESGREGEPDSSDYRGLHLHFASPLRMRQKVYRNGVYIYTDSLYRQSSIRNTYSAFGALPSVNFANVRLRERESDPTVLDANVTVCLNKPHSISFEPEGTNTAGDFGAAAAISYTNRNIFKGAESLSFKVRGAYEAITGLEGYSDQNYVEYSFETTLRFPRILLPLNEKIRRRSNAATEFSIAFNSQNRPEFHRRTLTGAWTYHWTSTPRNERLRLQHQLSLFSVNYIFMPWISDTFTENYLQSDDSRYAVLRYSYEDLFILNTAYSLLIRPAGPGSLNSDSGFRVRFSLESAGNLLYGLSNLFSTRQNADGTYTFFNIQYSQYVKFDFDYAQSFPLGGEHNALAMHAAFGIALPYGNSSIIPYEKRYYAGGANGVRGWSVRELGPGTYQGENGEIDFINQTGNLKLLTSVEFRTILFWKFQGALFIDAGNVWTTRSYEEQPGGRFRFSSFLRQIAVSYGAGLRMDLSYFILRFDLGMKAINPAEPHGRHHYPIICPRLSRDLTFHFAVGLPF